LCGRRVELRFDPYDLGRIEVYYAGRPFGQAVAHRVGRHVHPQAQEHDHEARLASGIDYTQLIVQEHATDRLARLISYHELAAGADDDDADDNDDGAGGVLALVRS